MELKLNLDLDHKNFIDSTLSMLWLLVVEEILIHETERARIFKGQWRKLNSGGHIME